MSRVDTAILRFPFPTAVLLFFAVMMIGGAAMPMDRWRAFAERRDQPFDERVQRRKRVAAAIAGPVLLGLGIWLLVV